MGEITALSIANTKRESLRSTVPMSIVKQFNLKRGDKLEWTLKAEGGEMIIVVKPLRG
jgi:bifunctional DNA-binding transcriptional regulator/antitoxin component of YhaV-PrlF toxin-antitoxin module